MSKTNPTPPAGKTTSSVVLKAKDPVRHDGQTFEPGDTLPDMSEEAAKSLVDSGAAELVIV